MELNFSPRPVSVTTPTMMPAPAQVEATLSTPSEPPASAVMKLDCSNPLRTGDLPRKTSKSTSAVSRRRKLVTIDTTVAQNTESTGENPHNMKTMIDTSDRKWNQYFF